MEFSEGRHLIVSLLQGFYWFDEGLQNFLRSRGWPEITRPQSMLMANLVLGVNRPSDIARRLGVSRQTIHVTVQQMSEKGVVKLVDDPEDKRMKIVVLTAIGAKMRTDAQHAMELMMAELARRIGRRRVTRMAEMHVAEWGAPMTFAPEKKARRKS